jgi:hypothetical protein
MNRPSFSLASVQFSLPAMLLALALPSESHAQHIGDIMLQPVAGRVQTGGYVDPGTGPVFVPAMRVFPATFGDVPNSTDEPGYETVEGVTFPDGTLIAFDVLDAVRKWDGNDFDAVPTETIRVTKSGTSVTSPAQANEVRQGFTFGQVSSGFLHEHLRYTLLGPQGDGVYLLQLRLRVPTGGFQDSLPFWIVFNQNAPENEHDAALAYMDQLVTPPCPGDLNGDNAVNTADLTRFLGRFGSSVLRGSNGDFNGDTLVNTADLTYFLGRFGSACQ